MKNDIHGGKKILLNRPVSTTFLVPNSLTDIVETIDIKPGYRSDHSIVEMQINTNKFVQGSGIWKFNNSLLKNQDYLNLINKVITEEKLKYALPVYNLDYIRDNNVTFSVDDDIFLETLFLRIRGETVKFSKFLKKKEKVLESNLKNDIAWLESNVNESNMKLLDDKKAELESIRKEKIKGYITRARIQWLDQGEKPTSFFCKLESKQFTEKTIRKLQLDNGFIINDQKMILKEVQKYCTNLFKEKETFSDFNLAKNITGNKVNQKNDIGKKHFCHGTWCCS